jgi:chemotaxis protein MotA
MERANRLLIAFAVATFIQAIIVVAYLNTGSETLPSIHRISILLGGSLSAGGYIQFITIFCFIWGLLEIRYQNGKNKLERAYFSTNLLPEEEHRVIEATEINQIRLRISQYLQQKNSEGKREDYFLLELVKKACTKFRANHSAESAFMIVESQSRINREKSESRQSGIRYLLWAIPSIGFVGTILGISQSLAIANTGDIDLITSTLAVAFDTTLVALVLSLIMMFSYHALQEATETLHHDIEEYVIEHFINKIDVS